MKKVCLAGFWGMQYVLGVAAIHTMYEGARMVSFALVVGSYFSTVLGGKLLGIGDEMQKDANSSVPGAVNVLWTLTCFFVVLVFASMVAGMNTIAGFRIPVSGPEALIILYGCAALRDLFLARFYFARHW